MHWRVRINGNPRDLSTLPKLLRSADFSVIQDGEEYFLISNRLDTITDPQEVFRLGREMLKQLSGALRLIHEARGSLTTDGVVLVEPDGRTIAYLYSRDEINVRDTVRELCSFESAQGVIKEISPGSEVQAWLGVAARDEAVARLLRFADVPQLDWVAMYKILEVVEEAMGGDQGIANKGWATKEELKRFRDTANSMRAAGDDARHGKQRKPPPSNPMSLERAQELIEGIARRWLDWVTMNKE